MPNTNNHWTTITEAYRVGYAQGRKERGKEVLDRSYGNPYNTFLEHNVWRAGFEDGAGIRD